MGQNADISGDLLGPAGIDPGDAGMRMRAAHDLAVQHVLHLVIHAVPDGARDFLDRVLDVQPMTYDFEIFLISSHFFLPPFGAQ